MNALNKATEPLSVALVFRDEGARAKLAEIREQAQRFWSPSLLRGAVQVGYSAIESR